MENLYDIIIIGGGPGGLSAAIYAARAKYRVLVIEKETFGGQITITAEVVNYPGVERTDGKKLTEAMRVQAGNFGAHFLMTEVVEVDFSKDIKVIRTEKGTYQSLGVVLATGASPRQLGFQGEAEFRGRGVAYCATCDGEFFTGLDVFVIGAGFAAAEEAVFLTKYAKKVYVIAREEEFTCAGAVAEKVLANKDIEVHFHTEIVEAGGEGQLEFAKFIDNHTGGTWEYRPEAGKSFGIFVFAGYVPSTKLFKGHVNLDPDGYLMTDEMKQTNIEGVYGAGDVCIKNLRQVVTAVSDGAIAATSLEKYVSSAYERLGLERRQEISETKHEPEERERDGKDGFYITSEMKQQLKPLFDKITRDITLKVVLDEREVSREVELFLSELEPLCEKVHCQYYEKGQLQSSHYPSIQFFNDKDEYLGIQFHGVPGGHEFNSFMIALYNAGSEGQPMEDSVKKRIHAIDKKLNLKIVVSLSCTMCPELVMAAQRIAVENKNIEAEMFDMNYYPELKENYKIMSVPCLIVNDDAVSFGKKNVERLVEFLEKI